MAHQVAQDQIHVRSGSLTRSHAIKRDQLRDRFLEGIRSLIIQFPCDGRGTIPGTADELGQLLGRQGNRPGHR